MSFQLRASLDCKAIRSEFSKDGFAHVAEILPVQNANRIYKCLTEDTPWNLVFNDRSRHIDMPEAQMRAMSRDDANRLQQAIFSQAGEGFQYCYNNYPVFDAYKAGQNRGHVLHLFYEFLNDEPFLEFTRRVSGFDDISFADAQATRFLPGHFLTTHDDTSEGKNRRVAYVFNFTRNWREDWGGYLQLLDDLGHIRRGLRPTFNALNLLAIPQRHNVGFVAPFAGGMRLSISGWLRHGKLP